MTKLTIGAGGETKLDGKRIGWTYRYTNSQTGVRGWRFDPLVGNGFKRLFMLTQKGIREELLAATKETAA